MRKGEGQDLTRRWTSSGECNGNYAPPQSADCEDPVTRSARCRYVHISRPIPGWGMRFTVGILLSRWRRQVRMLCSRDLTWSSSLPSAAICLRRDFHERKIPREPEKRRQKCFSLRNTFRRNVCYFTIMCTTCMYVKKSHLHLHLS